MVMALVVMILFAQLWLFTVTLEAMENQAVSIQVVIAALVLSIAGCGAVCALIRFFLRTESNQL
jgi:hypothetical protein